MEADHQRLFSLARYIQPSAGEPVRSVVLETHNAVVVVWHVAPGQSIAAHVHPQGQDTWTVLSGAADYIQGGGKIIPLKVGEIAVARPGEVHGAVNDGVEPFVFVSVVAPGNAGYALVDI